VIVAHLSGRSVLILSMLSPMREEYAGQRRGGPRWSSYTVRIVNRLGLWLTTQQSLRAAPRLVKLLQARSVRAHHELLDYFMQRTGHSLVRMKTRLARVQSLVNFNRRDLSRIPQPYTA
jgi:hypothetical protein